MRVRNVINSRGNEVRNQFIISTADGVYFQSYESVVAKVDGNGKLTFGRNWNYSNTTLKHLHSFLHEYGHDKSYKELHKMVENGQIEIVNLAIA